MQRRRLIALAAATLPARTTRAAGTGEVRPSHGFGIL